MANSNTLLNYEVALEMKWFTHALQNQGINYVAGAEFYKTLLYFKKIAEKKWPDPPLLTNDRVKNLEKQEKYFFSLQNLYAMEARTRIDEIRASYGNDPDIPEVIEERLIHNISI